MVDLSSKFGRRSEEHTSELQSGYISYAVFCLKKKSLIILTNGQVSHLFGTRPSDFAVEPRNLQDGHTGSSTGVLAAGNYFFFNDTATTEIYTLSLHDALPISAVSICDSPVTMTTSMSGCASLTRCRSEEHTSELQSRLHLVCRLLLGKKHTADFDLGGWVSDTLWRIHLT